MRKKHPDLRRRTFFTPLLMPIMVGILALLVLGWFYASMTTTTVILVRHAEKMTDQGKDPGLTDAGRERAAALAGMFAAADIDGLYASEYQRTQLTLQPLAEALDLAVTVVPASEPERLVKEVFEEHRSQTVIVAGHSNTLPALVQLFSGLEVAPIDDDDYRGIYILSLPRFGEQKIVELRYPE